MDVKEIIYPKPSEHLSNFQLFIKNKFSKNITKLEINLMYLYIILAGIFILILSNSFVGKSALSYKFVNLMSFIPAVEFSYQYISLQKAFFISSFLCMLVYFLIIIKQSLIKNLHEYGLFNIYELQDKKFYDRVAIRGEWPIIIFGLPITWLGFCWMFYDFFFIGVYLTQEDSFFKLYIYYILCFSGFLYIAIPFMFGTYLVLKNKIISVKKDK
ncbi:hypothetical protein [Campylobacter blaseri]|uniref:hypothetical protein n=1 Tax=Campylobacter blaseri TaxID=2042961 RepID=UPI0010570FB9|nr:hypothetical protein [Campylobacter blaseri]